jgi:hypothetical protein
MMKNKEDVKKNMVCLQNAIIRANNNVIFIAIYLFLINIKK